MQMRTEKRALDKIYKRRDRYEIPDWQREKVWARSKKQKLIDSILRNWKLPKFYFLRTSESPVEYEVVDGQQRLSAIFEFMDDELSLSQEAKILFGGAYYSELPDEVSDRFDDFEIEFDEISNATEKDLKEFFQRLQEGLPLTSSEKLNSVESRLRDFCRRLARRKFFDQTVSFDDKRYAYFDVCAKAAAIEIEGINVGSRYSDLKKIFESQAAFSSSSLVAKRLREALGFLHKSLPEKTPLMRNRSIVQSFITLACQLVNDGTSKGKQEVFGNFASHFISELTQQVELGQAATDPDYLAFQKTVNANVKSGPKTRHLVLLRKLLQYDPDFAESFDAKTLAGAGIAQAIHYEASAIAEMISKLNEGYSSKHGADLIKATNKTVVSLTSLGKPAKDFDGYKNLVENLYFVFWEGPGAKLKGKEPESFRDINDLRTSLQHDVDHGPSKKVEVKKKKHGNIFEKYSGVKSPIVVAPERFPVIHLKLLTAIRADVASLLTEYA